MTMIMDLRHHFQYDLALIFGEKLPLLVVPKLVLFQTMARTFGLG